MYKVSQSIGTAGTLNAGSLSRNAEDFSRFLTSARAEINTQKVKTYGMAV